jgi:Bacterial Ig domain/RTX calcium-binding nonapeptide repeat (4 copies)
LNIGHGPDTYLNGYDDIIYGGLGDDFIHGGAGDDAISGSEALPQFYNDTRPVSVAPFQYNRDLSINYWVDPITGQQNLFYDANNPLKKIVAPNGDDFILNFNSFDSSGKLIEDGKDWIYGDGGNDVVFGGTGQNRLFGGTGDDYLQADNNLNTNGGLNTTSDDATNPQATAGAGDFVYGGDGLDVMIADSGYDRMYDWGGEFNSFIVPFARFGEPTVNRSPNPHIMAFLEALSAAGGADSNLTDPNLVAGNVEIGLFDQSSPLWQQNHGGPRDPQPGNYPKGTFDNAGSPEDDTLQTPLQTAAGSTPTGHPPLHGNPPPPPNTAAITLQKDINAVDPLNPTAAEDANDPNNPRLLLIGSNVVWTYLVTNPGTAPLTINSITDDAGTPTVPGDDFSPIKVLQTGTSYDVGDTNHNGQLDPGETWLYTSAGVVSYQVKAGLYGNTATVSASGSGQTVTASDSNYHFGTDTILSVQKDINAVDPLHPTAAEDANNPNNPRQLVVGTNVVWTYLLTNPGTVPLTINSITDDAGTPTLPGDDFHPVYVSGDANNNHLLDAGETWLYTSAGVVSYQVKAGLYGNTANATATGTNGQLVTASASNYHFGTSTPLVLQKDINAVDPLHPTAAEDANDPNNPRQLVIGSNVVWTYLVTNASTATMTISSFTDDAGTPTVPGDDFHPAYVSGDTNHNNKLDPGETWLYTSAGVFSYHVKAGLYGNTATVTAAAPGNQTFTASDPNYHFGTDTLLVVQKDINAVDPLHPTAAEDANAPANPRMLPVGTSVTWTYLLTNPGLAPLGNISITDDAGTPTIPGDDFHPMYVSGDVNNNHLLDPGETWLYTSNGAVSVTTGLPVPLYTVQAGLYGNIATASATGTTGTTVMAKDSNWHFGTSPSILVRKLTNGVYSPTAPGQPLPVGTPVIWTYEVTDQGDAPVKVTSIRDDAGTPNNPADDFTAVPVLQVGTNYNIGDTNRNGLLDPGEVWNYTSAGVNTGSPTNWSEVLQAVYSNTDTSGAGATPGFVVDPVGTPNSFADNIFTNGGSKDVNGISDWQWKLQMPQDKDDLENAFGASVANTANGDTLLMGGVDRYAANGDATVGFWYFQNPVSVKPDGTFSGIHTDGDLLLVVDFSAGGSNPTVGLYRWVGSDATGTLAPINNVPAGAAFANVNGGPVAVPWTFIDKSGFTSPQAGEFLQAGVDLTALFGANVPRYVSFLAETRSSTSTTSTLSDFALGSVNTIGLTYTVRPGQYSNTVTATGVDQGTGGAVTSSATSFHFGEHQAAVAADDTATTNKATPVTIALLTNDSDPDGAPLTVTGLTQPKSGSLVLNADGTITYTPERGFTGADTFTYQATDGSLLSNAATVTITVG